MIWVSPGGVMEGIGERIRATRKRRVMSQAELAAAAGVALITINRLENGKGEPEPRPSTIRNVAKALDVEPGWLLFGDDDESKIAA